MIQRSTGIQKKLSNKAKAGAKFIQTQFCFDVELLTRYMDRIVASGLSEQLYFIVEIGRAHV